MTKGKLNDPKVEEEEKQGGQGNEKGMLALE
jgi:hypothetical protein